MDKRVLSNKKYKVFVGMSGGVDSSVSAALLKKANANNFEILFGYPAPKGFSGFDVTGVFIKVWSPDWLPCDWKEERRDAMRCAAVLQIPFITLDLSIEYKKGVVDYMIGEYEAGRIPNPDVMCNKTVKFGAFYDRAMNPPAGGGADYVATGHYARIAEECRTNAEQTRKTRTVNFQLLKGKDSNKDQSYFLWTLKQKQLPKILFPVGNLNKDEVRKLAKKFDLPTADKKDSQGLCFLGKIDVKEFLKRYIKNCKGKVLNENREIIGEHDGATLYSIGERHGFLINKKETDESPYYIISKDVKKNVLIVSHNKNEVVSSNKEIKLENVNWTRGGPPEINKKYSARIRYREDLKSCIVRKIIKNSATVIFDEPEEFIALGQSLVLYDGDICLGGGVIR